MLSANHAMAGLEGRPRNLFPVWLSLILIVLWRITVDLDIDFSTLAYGVSDMGEYFSRYRTPDFSRISTYLELILQTLATAFWGTVFALIVSVVLAPLAARNLSPHPLIYRLSREMLNFMRAMPDLLLALLFVAAIGLGPLAGIIALSIHTAGFLGKFFAESLERVDGGVYEALEAVGAGFLQTVMFAGWPSINREFVGYTLYIMDRNVRAASVLGLVGAGGIGLELNEALALFRYDRASAIMILIITVIIVIDHLSSYLRKKLN
ncbi:phosphonate ABC transporter, permease protein PhnE [Mariprofundus sp. EBB-1]|uniref:phosphonate ABC transporter, permease protein PhnE n=1 Tax=Mariprofundus sp. EBB-1 TaxID=2650971 RepID=UPI000EF247E4|nr:phosphonate ABC transporter, permease protein PhnE [Mariprofundus sp. EBB-1]RLL52722.1 phosphonate ABC transporter, permease protein PhnE [Mariprofundus sp. EBB-1]